jgi:A/G-specific adenine glycosylase
VKKNLMSAWIAWYLANARELPWRKTLDPYAIWLSEIILQQTRVNQGLPYYYRFLERFPSILDLARADEDSVLRIWQGLGYYSRARNLMKTAKIIAFERNGIFPDTYEDLVKLPGLGPYTASAIASFAFNLPEAVIDGNAYRVLSRLYDIDEEIGSKKVYHSFRELAQNLMLGYSPSTFNQALMELGAVICTPKPLCQQCPIAENCLALQNKTIHLRPVKKKAKPKEKVEMYYVLPISNSGDWILQKRPAKGIWSGLYVFPEVEKSQFRFESAHFLHLKHLLSHKEMDLYFELREFESVEDYPDSQLITPENIEETPFPVPFLLALQHWKLL